MKNIIVLKSVENQGNVTIDGNNPIFGEMSMQEVLDKFVPYTRLFENIIVKNFYSFDTDFTYDASPKFVDVIYRFRDVLRSYEKYSDEITYLYDSSSRPPYTTEEEKEAIKHLFAIIDEYQEEAFDLLGLDRSQRYQVTEDKAWTRYRNLTWHDYLYHVNWRNWKQSNESTTPENQDEE